MKALIAILLYGIVALSPLALSWSTGTQPRPFKYEIANGLGILAFSMILVEFVLSGRFKFLSRQIGMDVTMRFHQLMARTALAFAMLHPLLYTGSPSGGVRPWDPTRQLTLTTEFWPLATGIAAFLLLPSFVLLSFARTGLNYRYEIWRFLHGIGAVVIAGLLLHHATTAGRYGANPALAWLWSGMTLIAAGSLVKAYIIEPMTQYRRRWTVAAVDRLAPAMWKVVLSSKGKGLDYSAGQFAWLNIGHSPFSLHENPFSISSAPAQGNDLEFIIKELGDSTNQIGQVPLGTNAYLDAPYGSLCIEDADVPGAVLIAGGVGVAPMLSILRQMNLTDDPRKSLLIYGNRLQEQIVFREELDRLVASRQTEVVHVLSEPNPRWEGETGLVDANLLDRALSLEQIDTWVFVLCGPPQMMDAVEDHLIARGVPSARILSERFTYD